MPSWWGSGDGAGSSGGTGTFGGPTSTMGGGNKWINMETNQIRTFATGELTGEPSEFSRWGFDLTRRQRITGFCACLVGGFVVSLLGSILFVISPALFAILFSLGYLISLIGTGFLIGFKSQLKQMFKPVRLVTTLVMLGCFAMVWVSVFVLDITALAIIFCVLLYLSYIAYAISYIPGATTFLKSLFSRLF